MYLEYEINGIFSQGSFQELQDSEERELLLGPLLFSIYAATIIDLIAFHHPVFIPCHCSETKFNLKFYFSVLSQPEWKCSSVSRFLSVEVNLNPC